MKKIVIMIITAMLLVAMPAFAYQSLQEVFDQANGNDEYHKYIQLDPGMEYHGDLEIPPGLDVCIEGNGAIIWGLDSHKAIRVLASRLDISNCIVIGGNYGIHFDTMSTGSISNNTIVGCNYAGITVWFHDFNASMEIWDNIIIEGQVGLFCVEAQHPDYIGYNTVYNTDGHRYAEYCYG
ncbi:MAG: hypothetical protein GY839_12265 [candidate division Zixibacteria bacterium]|nr:hypothetical protein [candidate division Zixibacteria bacterium]